MKVDALLFGAESPQIQDLARTVEGLGCQALLTAEIKYDPFLPLAVAAGATSSLGLGTCVAVALPRSPTHLAQLANDLQRSSHGRFSLGIGSQIRPHVENRFGARWSKPIAQMRELVGAVRAVWSCWNDGKRLSFTGEYYQLSLMTPVFHPGPNPYGPPPIFIGAVGPGMARLAGEVADGLYGHAFATERSLREVTIPALAEGLSRSARERSEVEVSVPLFLVTGGDDREHEAADVAVRDQLAFYGSTPAYRPVLEVHGWGDLQAELNTLSKSGRWEEMSGLISDEVVDAFAVRGGASEIAAGVIRRYGALVDRVAVPIPARSDLGHWTDVVAALVAAGRQEVRLDPMPPERGRSDTLHTAG